MNPPTQELEIVAEKPQGIMAEPPAPGIEPAKQTAAQAKVDAVAALTLAAYQKAATLEITAEESAKLQADFSDDAFQTGAGGKENLIYIEHAHLRDRFNDVFGMGKWAIVPRNRWAESFTTAKGTPGERVYVEAMLVVRGCFVGEAVGAMEYYPKNESQNYGDAVEGAKTAAFRRCAKEFGVGLQAWKKEWCESWWARKRGQKPPQRTQTTIPPHPPAKSAPQVMREATAVTRAAMMEFLLASNVSEQDILGYAIDKAILMPNEGLADWPLDKVGTAKNIWMELLTAIKKWCDGDLATPATAPQTGNRIVGLVQAVNKKEGTSKKGKPYTKIGVKIADGWINTFDTKIFDLCEQAKDAGQAVDIEYKETDFGREIVSCFVAGEITP